MTVNFAQLPNSGTLTGTEIAPVMQGGSTVQTTTGAIAALSSAGFIAGTKTSAFVLANYAPSSSGGKSVYTSDMGLMICDGVRWSVGSNPPVPPGAQLVGACTNLFTCFPTVADIGNIAGASNANGAYRLYSGYAPYGNQPTASAYGTNANGIFTTSYVGSGGNNGLLTQNPYGTAKSYANYGILPMWSATRSFHCEYAATQTSNATDCWNAGFIMAQDNNNEQDDSNPAFVSKWEQWHEFDINEQGLGTNYSGAYRGSYLAHSGRYNWSQSLVSAPSGTITALPNLSTAWGGETGPWSVTLGGSGQVLTVNFTNGQVTSSCSSTVITGTPNSTITTGYNTFVNASNTDTTAIDNTVEHIFGGTYDQPNQLFYSWVDGIMIGSVSTASTSSNSFRDTLHYRWLFFCQSHGSPYTPNTMGIRYFSTWVP